MIIADNEQVGSMCTLLSTAAHLLVGIVGAGVACLQVQAMHLCSI
jgi:hypothetical protein